MQRRWSRLALALGLMALLGAGCWQGQARSGQATQPAETENGTELAEADAMAVDERVVEAQTAFGLALFEVLRQENPAENVLVSPMSVAIALSMAYNGAAGETQAEMAEVLRLQGIDLADLNQANQVLQRYLTSADPAVELAIANSLWLNQDLPVRPEFTAAMADLYGAEVATLDFTNANAKDIINGWVSEMTRDRIPTIVDSIDPDQLMFLINAIYFKGDWATAFDESLTTDRPFTLVDGREIQHSAMQQSGDFLYLETDQFQAISLPYGDGTLSFEVILPARGLSLESLLESLTPTQWRDWMNQQRSRPGTLQLPRFQFAYEADLIPALQALGMDIAFTDAADFSGLTTVDAAINQVRHKTFIDVSEEGTEAAAVTSIGIVATSMPAEPERPFVMEVDRPFLVAIRDRPTGTLLFIGSVVDPR